MKTNATDRRLVEAAKEALAELERLSVGGSFEEPDDNPVIAELRAAIAAAEKRATRPQSSATKRG
jgi:hypothetical protein